VSAAATKLPHSATVLIACNSRELKSGSVAMYVSAGSIHAGSGIIGFMGLRGAWMAGS
jgi:hypothetical protein